MKFSSVLASIVAFGGVTVLAAPAEEIGSLEVRANLPGLNAQQSAHARSIVAEVNKEKLGRQACLAGITTGLTESSLRVLANKAVPASTKYANDGYGSDHDSIGIFQQRAMYYKNIACDMAAQCSAGQFFTGMKAVKGWQTMDVAKLCQAVQRSAYPTAYQKYVGTARSVCTAAGL